MKINTFTFLLTSCLFSQSLIAKNFGGPDSVENQIADDQQSISAIVKERMLDPWFEWKEELKKESGIGLGIDYSAMYLASDIDQGEDSTSSGIFRFFGSWELTGRGTPNTGSLVWKVEHRHRYSDVPPGSYGLGDLGYAGVIAGSFNDNKDRLTNLYWKQYLNDGQASVMAGYVDPTDYVDTFVGGSPWTSFSNLVFSTGSASMFLPNEANPALVGGMMLTDNIYAVAGITNAYSDPTDPFDGSLDRFFNDEEHFISLEIGYTKGQDRIYLDNTHITLWQVDDSIDAGANEGWGLAFSHISYIDNHWMPFIRGGYADDGGSLLEKSISVGFLYQKNPGADLLGVGLNWGEVNEDTFGYGLDDQVTLEAFYRIPVTQQIALTPSIEYIKDPALNPNEDDIWLFGLRARAAF